VSVEPVIAPSARKHGISDEDIRHAYANPIHGVRGRRRLRHAHRSERGSVLLEIGVVEATTRPVVVHAMR
jgi:hypothetical protein